MFIFRYNHVNLCFKTAFPFFECNNLQYYIHHVNEFRVLYNLFTQRTFNLNSSSVEEKDSRSSCILLSYFRCNSSFALISLASFSKFLNRRFRRSSVALFKLFANILHCSTLQVSFDSNVSFCFCHSILSRFKCLSSLCFN